MVSSERVRIQVLRRRLLLVRLVLLELMMLSLDRRLLLLLLLLALVLLLLLLLLQRGHRCRLQRTPSLKRVCRPLLLHHKRGKGAGVGGAALGRSGLGARSTRMGPQHPRPRHGCRMKRR